MVETSRVYKEGDKVRTNLNYKEKNNKTIFGTVYSVLPNLKKDSNLNMVAITVDSQEGVEIIPQLRGLKLVCNEDDLVMDN